MYWPPLIGKPYYILSHGDVMFNLGSSYVKYLQYYINIINVLSIFNTSGKPYLKNWMAISDMTFDPNVKAILNIVSLLSDMYQLF